MVICALNSWQKNFSVLVESAIQVRDGGHVCQFCANQSHHTCDERKQKRLNMVLTTGSNDNRNQPSGFAPN